MTTASAQIMRLIQMGASPRRAVDYLLIEWADYPEQVAAGFRGVQPGSARENCRVVEEDLGYCPCPPEDTIEIADDPVIDMLSAGLTATQAVCAWWVEIEDRDPDTLAQLRGCTPGNINQQAKRGREALGLET